MFDQESTKVASPSHSPGTGASAVGQPRSSLPPHEAARTPEANRRIEDRILADAALQSFEDADLARREEWPAGTCENCGRDGAERLHRFRNEDGVIDHSCRGVRCDTCKGIVEAIDCEDGICRSCRRKAVQS